MFTVKYYYDPEDKKFTHETHAADSYVIKKEECQTKVIMQKEPYKNGGGSGSDTKTIAIDEGQHVYVENLAGKTIDHIKR